MHFEYRGGLISGVLIRGSSLCVIVENGSFRGTDSDVSAISHALYKERGYGARRERDRQVGDAQGQERPKHDRQDSRKKKVSKPGHE